jgi:hypothetical protein
MLNTWSFYPVRLPSRWPVARNTKLSHPSVESRATIFGVMRFSAPASKVMDLVR